MVEDLIIESIKIHGVDVYYLPRTMVNQDNLMVEDTLSTFEDAYMIEMYVKTFEGFDGEGDILTRFGIELKDRITFVISKRRFLEEITHGSTTLSIVRPREGDLIYFPTLNQFFQISFVEHESVFYQLGTYYVYELKCEKFRYSSERFDTGISFIDSIQTDYSSDMLVNRIQDTDGNYISDTGNNYIIDDSFVLGDKDFREQNKVIQDETDEFIDFSESNPFNTRM